MPPEAPGGGLYGFYRTVKTPLRGVGGVPNQPRFILFLFTDKQRRDHGSES